MSKKLKILLSAYACEPDKGSEPGIGWNIALQLAKNHEVWVLTRANNRQTIEATLAVSKYPELHFVYYDLPKWISWWKRGQRGIQVYYYLWQIAIYFEGKRLHSKINFDLTHHVTFVKYWVPCFLALLPVPFVWGPVGGGDTTPKSLWRGLSLRGKVYELKREVARWVSEKDIFLKITAKKSVLALATTEATATRLRRLGAKNIVRYSQVGLPNSDIEKLGQIPLSDPEIVRFVGIGNLLHLKGFHLALHAFAQANLQNSEIWIIGDGPERENLNKMAAKLGISNRIRFLGRLSRDQVAYKIRDCHILVQPCLHDSGGIACAEAMAAGRPVICLDLAGPALQVTDDTGIRISPSNYGSVVKAIAKAMRELGSNVHLRTAMSEAAKLRARHVFSWEVKGAELRNLYTSAGIS